MTRRPTLDDQLKEQASFVGPRQPPRAPKFTPRRDVRAVEDMLRRDFILQLETETELYEMATDRPGAVHFTSGSGTKS